MAKTLTIIYLYSQAVFKLCLGRKFDMSQVTGPCLMKVWCHVYGPSLWITLLNGQSLWSECYRVMCMWLCMSHNSVMYLVGLNYIHNRNYRIYPPNGPIFNIYFLEPGMAPIEVFFCAGLHPVHCGLPNIYFGITKWSGCFMMGYIICAIQWVWLWYICIAH